MAPCPVVENTVVTGNTVTKSSGDGVNVTSGSNGDLPAPTVQNNTISGSADRALVVGFKVHNTIFYCVANMPGAVPNTSTYALTNVTLRYAVSLAKLGVKAAFDRDPALAAGLNIAEGKVAHKSVSDAWNLDLTSRDDLVSV